MKKIAVVVVRPGPKGRHGDPAPASAATRKRLEGCMFAPGGSRELNFGQNSVDTDAQIYAPPGADVLPKDRIEVPGEGTFEVVGQPATWAGFGTVIGLKRFTG